MRRLLPLVLLALAPLAAHAQPDPYGPPPLAPGTFELQITGDVERTVTGPAVFAFIPRAQGDPAEPWTLTLRSGHDTFVFQRDAGRPGLEGAPVGDGDLEARRRQPPYHVLVLAQLADEFIGFHSTGSVPPASANHMRVAESDDEHVLGSFDFAAMQVGFDQEEGRRIRVVGRYHALAPDAVPPGSDAMPDFGAFSAHVGGVPWSGVASFVGVAGQGLQIQLSGGAAAASAGTITFGLMGAGAVQASRTYRLLDPNNLTGPPPADAMLGGISPTTPPPLFFRSGSVTITAMTEDRVSGTFHGIAAPPEGMAGPAQAVFGAFSARAQTGAVPGDADQPGGEGN
jgi:hypothetical protein